MRKLIEAIKAYRKKKKYEQYLRDVDRQYYDTFQNCFSLFPPSFYLTHTQEEIDKITKETQEKLKKLIDELE